MSEQSVTVAAAVPVTEQPVAVGEVYRAWAAANDVWAAAAERLKAVQAECDAARTRANNLEQRLGELALEGVPRANDFRGRSGWVVMAGRLYFVDEHGNEADGWRYEVRPQEVRKVAV